MPLGRFCYSEILLEFSMQLGQKYTDAWPPYANDWPKPSAINPATSIYLSYKTKVLTLIATHYKFHFGAILNYNLDHYRLPEWLSMMPNRNTAPGKLANNYYSVSCSSRSQEYACYVAYGRSFFIVGRHDKRVPSVFGSSLEARCRLRRWSLFPTSPKHIPRCKVRHTSNLELFRQNRYHDRSGSLES